MSQSDSSDTKVLSDIIDQLENDTSGKEVSVGNVVEAFDDRSLGALCTVIGLIAATPIIGAIPGVSVISGVLIFLIAGQFVLGRTSPWLPPSLTKRSISRDELIKGTESARPYANWLDQYVKPRIQWLVGGIVQRRVIATGMCILALTMIPLALVPWGVLPPATAIVAFGVAMIGRDGFFAALGYILSAFTLAILIYFWGTIGSAVTWLLGG